MLHKVCTTTSALSTEFVQIHPLCGSPALPCRRPPPPPSPCTSASTQYLCTPTTNSSSSNTNLSRKRSQRGESSFSLIRLSLLKVRSSQASDLSFFDRKRLRRSQWSWWSVHAQCIQRGSHIHTHMSLLKASSGSTKQHTMAKQPKMSGQSLF